MAEVMVSKRYEGSAAEMWRRIGDPGDLAGWHPAVERTKMVDGGVTRINTVTGGAQVVEPIVALAEDRYTFRITEGPFPLRDFLSTLQVRGDGPDGCVVEWRASFEPDGVGEAEATEMVCGFFQAGLEALQV